MNDRQIETIIQHAEKQAGANSFIGARLVGVPAVISTPFIFLSEMSAVIGVFSIVCWLVTASLWSEGRKIKRELTKSQARVVWQELDHMGAFGPNPSLREKGLLRDIGCIYARDPRGEIFPLPQAIRLTLAWKQQQKRLHLVESHIQQMHITRATLEEKQNLLRQLHDENPGLQRALASLSDDIDLLESSRDALRASCARLEALIVQIDASARRRELHREVGEITARLTSGKAEDGFELADEHLDIERQIGREIETYLQLERETEAHLRDL